MEDIKIDNDKLNKAIEKNDLPEVPRTIEGKIDLEAIAIGKNEKDFYIVPDEIFNSYYKELPAGTINQSKTKRATATGGYIGIFGNDPEADKEKQIAGGKALQAAIKQRRKLSETIDIFLRQKASIEEIEQLGLEDGATKQDALIAAMFTRAIEQKDVQAFNSLRDTAGEKPTEKIAAEVETITPEDRKQIERILNRTKTQDIVNDIE
jgi:hypothetical protein